jgi:hypothetical protein
VIQAPVEEALALLIDDRIPAVTESPGSANEVVVGALYQAATIEVYVAGVMELYAAQSSAGTNHHPNPRTDAVASLIQRRKLDRARIARESYEDRGIHGYAGGYTAEQLRAMQAILIEDQNELVSSSLYINYG